MSHPRPRRARRKRHSRIDHELKGEDREAYLALLREPRTTNKSAHAWLCARGYSFSESAVARHMRHYLEGAHEQRVGEQFAMRYLDLPESGRVSPEHFLRAALFRMDQLLFERQWSCAATSGR